MGHDRLTITLITGAKNNSGDFLIKKAVTELFQNYFPNTKFHHVNSWDEYNDDIEIKFNESSLIVLAGGPAIQNSTIPKVYKVINPSYFKDYSKLLLFGLGAKSFKDNSLENFDFNQSTLEFFRLIKTNNLFPHSVRDFGTQKLLNTLGLKKIHMTGCPVCYLDYKKKLQNNKEHVAFSLGVSHIYDKGMKEQMKKIILLCSERYKSKLVVAFHHSLNSNDYKSNKQETTHFKSHEEFNDWLKTQKIRTVDISKSDEKMRAFYGNSILHIGYRVHAHIYSISRGIPSILISEDSRAISMSDTLNSKTLKGFLSVRDSFLNKVLRKLKIQNSVFKLNKSLMKELNIRLEESNLDESNKYSQEALSKNFESMDKFFNELKIQINARVSNI